MQGHARGDGGAEGLAEKQRAGGGVGERVQDEVGQGDAVG